MRSSTLPDCSSYLHCEQSAKFGGSFCFQAAATPDYRAFATLFGAWNSALSVRDSCVA